MDLLWQKESNNAGALFVDVFKNVPIDYPDQHSIILREISTANNGINKTKNDTLSTYYRQRGNEEFQSQNWLEAITWYNTSLCFAIIGSENVSLAYANRSACFLHLKKYQNCIVDIELAKKANYPERLMFKLEKRQADCLTMNNKSHLQNESEPKLSFEPNPDFEGMGSVLQIKFDEQYGRCVVAICDIDVGKTVLFEKAFVSKEHSDEISHDYNSCTICFKSSTNVNLIACDQCAKVMFCSSACAGAGNDAHKLECESWRNISTNLNFILRLISIGLNTFSNVENWMEFVQHAVKEQPIPNSLNDIKSKYRALLQLNIFVPTEKRRPFIIGAYSAFRHILIENAVKTMFDTVKKERFLMHLVLQHVLALSCNAFKYEDNQKHKFGFIITSYFSHSCAPNLSIENHGNYAIGTTLRPIQKGQQLFVSYNRDTLGAKSSNHQKFLLENFDFHCKCEKCNPQHGNMLPYYLESDSEYESLLNLIIELEFDAEKLIPLQKRLIGLLNRFGGMPWCGQLGVMVHAYAITLQKTIAKNI